MSDVLIVKNLNRWFKEKWVDVSRKDKDGKHPPCGRSKAKKGSKGYPKCRPSVKVSSKTPKTSGSMSEGEKRSATKRKRSKKQGVGGKPTIVKSPMDIAMRLLKYQDYEILDDTGIDQRYTNLKVSPLNAFDHDLGFPIEGSMSEREGMQNAISSPSEQAILDATRQSLDEQGQIDFDKKIDIDPYDEYAHIPYADKVYRRLQISPEGTSTIMPYEMADSYREKNLPPNIPYESKPAGYWPEGIYPYDDPSTWYDEEEDGINPLERLQRFSDMGIQGAKNFEQKNASEPMDIAFQLLKDAVSPEAKRHKLEYDKKYESSPERVKYREELNRERRKRGIYGHGGPDMSHTKDHTLVAESPHANRARHFKERGTLKG